MSLDIKQSVFKDLAMLFVLFFSSIDFPDQSKERNMLYYLRIAGRGIDRVHVVFMDMNEKGHTKSIFEEFIQNSGVKNCRSNTVALLPQSVVISAVYSIPILDALVSVMVMDEGNEHDDMSSFF